MNGFFKSRMDAEKQIANAAGHGNNKLKASLIAKAHRQYPPKK